MLVFYHWILVTRYGTRLVLGMQVWSREYIDFTVAKGGRGETRAHAAFMACFL